MTDFSDLVDTGIIAEWETQFQSALNRRKQAATDLAAAKDAHRKATIASERAIAGISGDPLAAEEALTKSATALRVAEKIHAAAEAAFTRANGRKRVAYGLAHKPVYTHGIKLRVAAAKAHDAAMAALAQADADYKAATALMQVACQNGCSDVHGALNDMGNVRSEAAERAVWTGRRINPDAPVHPWQPE